MTVFLATIIICAFILYVIFSARSRQKIEFRDVRRCDESALTLLTENLAKKHRRYSAFGNGIDIKELRKIVTFSNKFINRYLNANDTEFNFFTRLLDAYPYAIKLCDELQNFAFESLPHCDGKPRLYTLLKQIVFDFDGCVDLTVISKCLQVYNYSAEMTFNEINHFDKVLKAVVLELYAYYCKKAHLILSNLIKGRADAKANKPDYSKIKYNSYAYAFYNNCIDTATFSSLCLSNGSKVEERIKNFNFAMRENSRVVSGIIDGIFTAFNDVSLEYLLTISPVSSLFSAEDETYGLLKTDTAFYYLRRVYEIAIKTKKSEMSVAREILFLSKENCNDISKYLMPKVTKTKSAFFVLFPFVLGVACAILFCYFLLPRFVIPLIITLPIFICFFEQLRIRILRFAVKSRKLPAYDLNRHNVTSHTLITLPRVITNVDDVDKAFDDVLESRCANLQSFFYYNLLLDLPNANSVTDTKDGAIIDKITERFNRTDANFRISVILRKRKKVSENFYCCYEQQYGALLNLNEFLLTQKHDFLLKLGDIPKVKYVITIGNQTHSNSLYKLIEYAEHPYNKRFTVFSTAPKIIPSGRSVFAKVFYKAFYLNLANVSSIAEFDAFEKGSFFGTGLYRLQEFYENVSTVIKENSLLNYEYILGAFANCANTDVQVYKPFANNFNEFFIHGLRRLSGYVFQLRYLFNRRVEGKKRNKRTIGCIAKQRVIFSFLYGILPISYLLTVIYSIIFSTPLATVTIVIIPLFSVLFHLKYVFNDKSIFYRQLLYEAFSLCVIPLYAFFNAYDIFMSFMRIITRQNVNKSNKDVENEVSLLPNAIFTAVIITTAIIFRRNAIFYVIAGVSFLGILLVKIFNITTKGELKSSEFKAELNDVAKKTFAYFKDACISKNNYLPISWFSEKAKLKRANYTTPNDIAMAILAYCSALELGFCSYDEFENTTDKIIDVITCIKKWNGHLRDVIDIKTLNLLSDHVSTEQSGNLLASLLLLSTYAREETKNKIYELINEMDFSVLIDEKNKVLRFGYDVSFQKLDDDSYDVLFSDALLTYLVLIGCGKIDSDIYYNLHRIKSKGGYSNILSSYGGLWEYLFANVFFDYSYGTLLSLSAKRAVAIQLRYAEKQKLHAFGVSKMSLIDDVEPQKCGVPSLAVVPMQDKRCSALYSAFLAVDYAQYHAWDACEFMRDNHLIKEYGVVESYDFIKEMPQETIFARCQGAILGAICNYLTDGIIKRKFETLPQIKVAKLVTYELPRASYDIRLAKIVPCYKKYNVKSDCETVFPLIDLKGSKDLRVILDSRCSLSLSYRNQPTLYAINHPLTQMRYECGETIIPQFSQFYSNDRVVVYKGKSEYAVFEHEVGVVDELSAIIERTRVYITNKNSVNCLARAYTRVDSENYQTFESVKCDSDCVYAITSNGTYVARAILDNTAEYYNDFFDLCDIKGGNKDRVLGAKVEVPLYKTNEIYFNVATVFADSVTELKNKIKLLNSYANVSNIYSEFDYSQKEKEFVSKLLYSTYGIEVPTQPITVNVKFTNNERGFADDLQKVLTAVDFSIPITLNVIVDENKNYFDYLREKVYCIVDEINKNKIKNVNVVNKGCEDGIDLSTVDFSPLAERKRSDVKAVIKPCNDYEIVKKTSVGGFANNGSFVISDVSNLIYCWQNVIFGDGYYSFSSAFGNRKTYANGIKVTCDESFVISLNGKTFNVFDGNCRNYTCVFGLGYTEYCATYDEMKVTLREQIIDGVGKLFELKLLTDKNADLHIAFAVRPYLSDGDRVKNKDFYVVRNDVNSIKMTNNENGISAYIHSNKVIEEYCAHLEQFSRYGTVIVNEFYTKGVIPCACVSVSEKTTDNVESVIKFYLSFSATNKKEYDDNFAFYENFAHVKVADSGKLFGLSEYLKWGAYQVMAKSAKNKNVFSKIIDARAKTLFNGYDARNEILQYAELSLDVTEMAMLIIAVVDYVDITGDFTILAERVCVKKQNFVIKRVDLLDRMIEFSSTCRISDGGLIAKSNVDSVSATILVYYAITKLIPRVNNTETERELTALCARLKKAVENCYDVDRYVKGYENNVILGGRLSKNTQIDFITQALASIVEIDCFEKTSTALKTALNVLGDYENYRILFDESEKCDLIALLMAIALYKNNKDEQAYELLSWVLPYLNGYGKLVSPTLIEEDEKFNPLASLSYITLTEYLLGVKIHGNFIKFDPHLPKEIGELSFRVRCGAIWVKVKILNSSESGLYWKLKINGVTYNTDVVHVSESMREKEILVFKA